MCYVIFNMKLDKFIYKKVDWYGDIKWRWKSNIFQPFSSKFINDFKEAKNFDKTLFRDDHYNLYINNLLPHDGHILIVPFKEIKQCSYEFSFEKAFKL